MARMQLLGGLAVLVLLSPVLLLSYLGALLLRPVEARVVMVSALRNLQWLCSRKNEAPRAPAVEELEFVHRADIESHARLVVRSLIQNIHTHPDWIEKREGSIRVRTRVSPELLSLRGTIFRRAAEMVVQQGYWSHVDMSDETGIVYFERRVG